MTQIFDFRKTTANDNGSLLDSVGVDNKQAELSKDTFWAAINEDSRQNNGGLGDLPVQTKSVVEIEVVKPSSIRNELNEIGHRDDGALAFGKSVEGILLTSIDFESKLLSLIENAPNFSLRCTPLSKPAKYGATHIWAFEAELFPSPEPVYGVASILGIIPGRTLKNEFAISLTYKRIKSFLYRNKKNEIRLKLKVELKDGSLIVSGV
jgi:hypothetical protein